MIVPRSTLSFKVTSRVRLLSISRMLDLGGSPSSLHDKSAIRIDASKNCKLQSVWFDFVVLTRSVDQQKQPLQKDVQEERLVLGNVKADAAKVQEIASLLNIPLGQERTPTKSFSDPKPGKPSTIDVADVRARYADKLSRKGIRPEGVPSASRPQDKGDACMFAAGKTTKWMASTGSGSLLQYLTRRSVKLALLPQPNKDKGNDEDDDEELRRMQDFAKQLGDQVVIDLLVEHGARSADAIVKETLEKLELQPNQVLLISDREDYLKAANGRGIITCRIRPHNAPRGNISTPYVAESVPDVRDVVDEINGISFNAVLQQQR